MRLLNWLGIWVLCLLCAVLALVIMPIAVAFRWRIGIEIAIGFDQIGNLMLGGRVDQTISARAAAARSERTWACALCHLLDKVDDGHCDRVKL